MLGDPQLRSVFDFPCLSLYKLYVSLFPFQSIDLHALTGWIPERTSIKRNSPTFNESMHFDRLLNGVRRGNNLQSVSYKHKDVDSPVSKPRSGLL